MGISLKNISEAAGVSISTVSRALSDDPEVRKRVSLENRERIRQLANNLGYSPNFNARSLKSKFTKTFGLIVTSAADPFWSIIIDAAERVLAEVGWSLFIAYSHNDLDREVEVINTLHGRRVDAIMIAASKIGSSSQHLKRLLNIDAEILMINRQGEGMIDDFHYVGVDDELGAEMATNHLIYLGHKNIGYLGISDRARSNYRRKKGFFRACEKVGLDFNRNNVFMATLSNKPMEAGIRLAGRIFGDEILKTIAEKRITALFCFNDILALGVLMECRRRGIKVPGEISVMGFDGLMITEFSSPALSTISQPRKEIGTFSADLLLSLIGMGDDTVRQYLAKKNISTPLESMPFMSPKLIPRESTSHPPK